MMASSTPTTMNRPISTSGNYTVAFTTPPKHASTVSELLKAKSVFTLLWCPTITTETTPFKLCSISFQLSPHCLSLLSAIAFSSHAAISGVSTAVRSIRTPLLPPSDDPFIFAFFGKDAELIDDNFLRTFCPNIERITVLVPPIDTPSSMVDCLGPGGGRSVHCPVPIVVGLTEPPGIDDFFAKLKEAGWVPVRVQAYEIRWVGPNCAERIVRKDGRLDALVFTNPAEVEGFLKSLDFFGWDWAFVTKRWPELVVALEGVTAAEAERLGVRVDVVSENYGSFEGLVDALERRLLGSD